MIFCYEYFLMTKNNKAANKKVRKVIICTRLSATYLVISLSMQSKVMSKENKLLQKGWICRIIFLFVQWCMHIQQQLYYFLREKCIFFSASILNRKENISIKALLCVFAWNNYVNSNITRTTNYTYCVSV